MDGWKERLEAEHREMLARLAKLEAFVFSDQSQALSKRGKDLLIEQSGYMRGYVNVLEHRLHLERGGQ